MLVKPSALNILVIGFSMVIFSFLWRMGATWVEQRNPTLAGAMGVVL